MNAPKLSPDTFRRLLRYEPETGKLYWRSRTIDLCTSENAMKGFNTQFAGKEAFTADNGEGYRCSCIRGRQFKAHRVIWAIVHGKWPKDQIDHINGDRSDNRLCNLREVTNAQNQWNRKPSAGCISRHKGVTFIRRTKRWQARIVVNGKRQSLGVFPTESAARDAYSKASRQLHGEHGRV